MPVGGGGLTSSPGAVTHKLEADFSGTAFGGTPTWTDITGCWMSSGTDPGGSSATIPWGRQDQSTTVESSTTSFTLNNSDGRFTPGKVSSPYYPNVKRRVRMRHTITEGTTTLTLFDGYVDSWSVAAQTDGPTLATASLSDGFARLSASTELRSFYAEEVLLDSPLAFYPLTEETGATSFGDLAGQHAAGALTPSKYGASPAAAGTQIAGAVIGTGVTFSNGSITGPQTVVTLPSAAVPATATFTFEAWIVTTAAPGVGQTIVEAVSPDSTRKIGISTAGTNVAVIPSAGSGIAATVTANDGQPHHVVGTYDGTTLSVYFDGALGASTPRSATAFTPSAGYIGGSLNYGNTLEYGFTGTVSGVAIYATALSAARVLAHYNAGKTAFAGESTAARFAHLLTYRPSLGGTTTGTMGTVGAGDLTGMSLGDALTDTAAAEGGVIQSNRGTLTLIGRSNWYDPASALTLDAANGEVDLPTTWRDDTQGLVNDVTVDRPNGAAQRAVNATSVAADGVAQTSATANLNSDRDAADMAGWLVAVGVREQLDSPTLTVNLYARSSAVLTMAVCALKTYDVVTLTNLPASAPASTMTFQVQGGTYTVGANTFTAELYTTTMPPTVLRADATADAYTKLDAGNVIAW